MKSNQYQNVSTDLFKKSLEEFYHKNTDSFFDKYIYGKESMDLIVKGDLNYKKSEIGYVSKIILDEKEKAEYIPVYISA